MGLQWRLLARRGPEVGRGQGDANKTLPAGCPGPDVLIVCADALLEVGSFSKCICPQKPPSQDYRKGVEIIMTLDFLHFSPQDRLLG